MGWAFPIQSITMEISEIHNIWFPIFPSPVPQHQRNRYELTVWSWVLEKLKSSFLFFCPSDAPVLSLRMGSSLNPHDIKEGDDVYFECLIKANPPVHKLSWFHNVSTFLYIITSFSYMPIIASPCCVLTYTFLAHLFPFNFPHAFLFRFAILLLVFTYLGFFFNLKIHVPICGNKLQCFNASQSFF